MRTPKKYEYLVSFKHSSGYGTSYILRSEKINSAEEALGVQRFIEKENDLKDVALVNFVLLRKVRRPQ